MFPANRYLAAVVDDVNDVCASNNREVDDAIAEEDVQEMRSAVMTPVLDDFE